MIWTGLTGGIMKVSSECKQAGGELKNGVGVTVYHFVDSIDGVSRSPSHIFLFHFSIVNWERVLIDGSEALDKGEG
jgi:hypothetical protein